MLQYDMQIAHGNLECVPNLLEALTHSSLYWLPLNYPDSNKSRYECAWRLGQWDLNRTEADSNTSTFEEYKYFAMKSLHDKDDNNFLNYLNSARKASMESLRHTSLESSKNVYDALYKLQCLQEMEDFHLETIENVEELLEKWRVQNYIRKNNFGLVEPILMQRIVLMQNVLSEENGVRELLTDMQLEATGQYTIFVTVRTTYLQHVCNIATKPVGFR